MRLTQRVALKFIRTKFKLLSSISKRKAAIKAYELFCTPQYRNRKKLPRIFEQAEKLMFPFHQYSIRGYCWNREAKKKVLILHGFESSVINFDRYIQPLIKKGYGVLAFDAPAHGRSSGKQINILIYKAFIQEVIKKYGPVSCFLAHSLGGLALSLVMEEIPHDESVKMVLIAPATETVTAIDSFFRFLKLNDEVKAAFHKHIEKKSGFAPLWFSIARAAANIKASVLWCHDKNDDMTPLSDIYPVIQANYPNFTFYLTEGLGHRRIYRDNKVTKAIIEFL